MLQRLSKSFSLDKGLCFAAIACLRSFLKVGRKVFFAGSFLVDEIAHDVEPSDS